MFPPVNTEYSRFIKYYAAIITKKTLWVKTQSVFAFIIIIT